MPALTRIRIPALLDLAEQQRYTPPKALLRQIDRAEALASEIDPELTYPEDWVVFRITGFRPDMEDPRIIPGEALRSDLSALVERLSDQSSLTREALTGTTLTLDELAARWGVSRKTIERYRRRGLVGRRVTGAEGGAAGTRLVFTTRAVESFEGANPELLGNASAFTRLDEAERRRVVDRAARYDRRLGWSRNQIIGRLAQRLGRSRETIRRTLEDEGSAVAPAPRLAPDECRAIFEEDRRGAEPDTLAKRHHRSRASIHRIINARRGDLLRRMDLSIPADEKTPRSILDSTFEDDAARTGLGIEVIHDPRRWIADARVAPAEAGEEEHARALAYHALRDRARCAIESLERHNPAAIALDRIETDLRWATLLKRALVHAQRGLIVRSIEERAGAALEDVSLGRLCELHRVAYLAVGASVDRHWPARAGGGGRLSAPAALALGRVLSHEVGGAPGGRARLMDGQGAGGLGDWTLGLTPWQGFLDPPRGIGAVLGAFDEETAAVVGGRFGLEGSAPMTLEEIERDLRTGRVRALRLIRGVVRACVRTGDGSPVGTRGVE